MKTINTIMFATALTITLFGPLALADSGSADKLLKNMLVDYQHLSQRGQWINTLMPAATGEPVFAGLSADQKLTEIVAAYTRESLDRGGWVNAMLHNADYASGNSLLAVQVGEGVTEGVASLDTPLLVSEVAKLQH